MTTADRPAGFVAPYAVGLLDDATGSAATYAYAPSRPEGRLTEPAVSGPGVEVR